MKSWLPLLGSPSLALAAQSALYALVTPSCAAQSRLWIHLCGAGALALSLVLAGIALREWKTFAAGGDAQATRRFVAAAATGVAAISCLVIAMMWVAAWVLSPCSEQ